MCNPLQNDLVQTLGLNPTLYCKDGTPHASNPLQPSHAQVLRIFDEAMRIDRNISLKVLDLLPVSTTQFPGSIT